MKHTFQGITVKSVLYFSALPFNNPFFVFVKTNTLRTMQTGKLMESAWLLVSHLLRMDSFLEECFFRVWISFEGCWFGLGWSEVWRCFGPSVCKRRMAVLGGGLGVAETAAGSHGRHHDVTQNLRQSHAAHLSHRHPWRHPIIFFNSTRKSKIEIFPLTFRN